MRLSTDKDDPGYDGLRAIYCSVYVDGQLERYAITADEEQGYVLRFVVKDGEVQHDGERVLTEEVHGKVEIRLGGPPGDIALMPVEVTLGVEGGALLDSRRERTPEGDELAYLLLEVNQTPDMRVPRAPRELVSAAGIGLWRCTACLAVLKSERGDCPNGCTVQES